MPGGVMRRAGSYLALLIYVCCNTSAQQHPDISGFWELHYDSRNVPPAALNADTAARSAEIVQHDQEAIRWCINLGVPFMMDDAYPIDIRQSPTVIGMVARAPSSVRYIYTDARTHPAKEEYDPTTNGNSIGHWEGDTLVVDTIEFNDRGAVAIPGGGMRTPTSHLVERYRVLNGGQQLAVTFTWEDSAVFVRPHSYEFRYYRTSGITGPRVLGCNVNDKERAKFLTEPPPSAEGRQ
jgi:hypothetical protein